MSILKKPPKVEEEAPDDKFKDVHIEVLDGSGGGRGHPEDSVSIAWSDLTYTIPNKNPMQQRYVIKNCSGIVNPGEIMAIIGPSGAGKSTLLNVLAGRKDPKNVTGSIFLNGESDENVKLVSTYVMQDENALMGSLTVRENIQFAADLCFSESVTHSERVEKVSGIIKEFGLERVADSNVVVRGISAGEKRRTVIASQVVTHPKIIFLDEPTTGLDSVAAYYVMEAIINTAKAHNLAVIASIRQPSSEVFALFDKLYLISRGRTIYHGPREAALEYFKKLGHECPEHANPADFYLSKIDIDFMPEREIGERQIQRFITKYETSVARQLADKEIDKLVEINEKEEVVMEEVVSEEDVMEEDVMELIEEFNVPQRLGKYARGFFVQTYFITRRSFTNARRNVLIRIAMYVCLAIFMGTVWWQVGYSQKNIDDRFSAHFFLVAVLALTSVAGIPGFLEERLVFRRERANGFYSVGPYALANLLVSIPLVFVRAFVFAAIAYPMIGLHKGFGHFMWFLTYLYLALMVAESMVVFVSAVIPIFVAALTAVTFLNGFFMVVQGFLVRRDSIPRAWKWAHYINYQKYAFEGIIKNDFVGLTFNCDTLPSGEYVCLYGDRSGKSSTFTGQDVLDSFGYTEIQMGLWAFALIGLTIAFRIGFHAALRLRKDRR